MSGWGSKGRQRTRKIAVSLPGLDTAPANWLRSIRLSGFTIAALMLIVLTVVVLAPSLRILIEQRQEVARLQSEVATQQQAVDDLTRQRARWDDPNYIQSLARQRLDYVYPGEYSYLVIDDGQTPTTADGLPISQEIQTTEVDWAASLLSSVLTAGLTDAPPDDVVPSEVDPATDPATDPTTDPATEPGTGG